MSEDQNERTKSRMHIVLNPFHYKLKRTKDQEREFGEKIQAMNWFCSLFNDEHGEVFAKKAKKKNGQHKKCKQ